MPKHNFLHTLIFFAVALCMLSCNKELKFNNPLDPQATIDKPTDIEIVSLNETSVELRWKFSTKYPNLLKQYIERSSNSGSFTIVDSVDANITSKKITAIFYSDIIYNFRITAKTDNANSSSSVSNSTSLSFPAPSNLQVTSMTTTQVNLSWTDNSIFETSFEIEQSTNSTTGYTVVKNVSSNVTSTIVTGSFDPVTTYYFRVRAKSQYNISQYSNAPSYNIAAPAPAIGLILVEGGTFTMGSPNGTGESDEQPQHSVTLSDFYIGRFEVTQKRWREVVQWKQGSSSSPLTPNPSYFSGDSLPVESVSWNDIQTWLGYLNERDGITDNTKKYRLPTEAEWEYAARGGKNWTNNFTYSGSNTIGNVAWYSSNSGSTTKTVGTKTTNQLGIYDMSGNVWEWCNDWYGAYSSTSQTNPAGPTSGSSRVLRGGSCYSSENYCRVANRDVVTPDLRNGNIGFRYARNK